MHPADIAAQYVSVRDGFNEMADTYDARLAGNPLLVLESRAVLGALPDLAGLETVADFGCGTGRWSLQMARAGAQTVVGIDAAPAMLALAERKARKGDLGDTTRWQEGELGASPLALPGGFFEAGLCALMLSFVSDVNAAFAEMARTLRPGAALVVSDYHPHGLCAARAASEAALARDKAPYQRFTSASGDEKRVVQFPRPFSEIWAGARGAGLTLETLAEPACDHRLASEYGGAWRAQIGIPLVLVARFRKG